MSKSFWKFNHMSKHIIKNIYISKFKNVLYKNIFDRKSNIPSIFLKKNVQIYKGSSFSNIFLSKYSLNYKFGEFGFTRKPFKFPQKKFKK